MSLFPLLSSILILAAVGFVLLNEVYQQRTKVSPMPTVPKVRDKMLALAAAQEPGKVAELGAGWGTLAIPLARRFPEREIVALELSPLPFLVLHLRKWLNGLGNLKILRRNFFDYDLGDTQTVLCYLSNPHMAQLEPKFRAELKPGAKIISSTFHMPEWKPAQTLELEGMYNTKIFVYVV